MDVSRLWRFSFSHRIQTPDGTFWLLLLKQRKRRVSLCFFSYITMKLFIHFLGLVHYYGIYGSDVFNHTSLVLGCGEMNICPKFPNTYEMDVPLSHETLMLCDRALGPWGHIHSPRKPSGSSQGQDASTPRAPCSPRSLPQAGPTPCLEAVPRRCRLVRRVGPSLRLAPGPALPLLSLSEDTYFLC